MPEDDSFCSLAPLDRTGCDGACGRHDRWRRSGLVCPPGPNTPEKIPTGILPSSLPGATAFGSTPPSTPEQVSFILKERNRYQLESAVAGGLSSFDSVSQFASEYGQTSDVVSALTSYLASFGITTTVYPGNVDVSASGTAGEFNAALSVQTKDYHVPAQHGSDGYQVPAQTVYCTTGAPELPYRIGQYVLAILGLTNYAPFASHTVAREQQDHREAVLVLLG